VSPVNEHDRTRNLIIGVGTEYGDDAFGLMVIRFLAGRLPFGWRAIEHSGEGASLMEAWQGCDHVVIVDCTRSGSAPGAEFRFDISRERIPTKFFHYSTHAFGVAEAIETARVLDRLPARMLVYGVEGGQFQPGTPLSPEIASKVALTAGTILADLSAD
jgi:hydrogenase maturation protease